MASATVENYIKQVLLLREEAGAAGVAGKTPVPLGKLSARMNVSPGTATTMAKSMARSGFLQYRSRAGVALTAKGEKLALQVLRKHRLIEMFLVSTLGFDLSEVHVEAEALEHAISEKLLARIDAFLGNPQFDPHGDAIPSADGKIVQRKMRPLSECTAGDRVCISWIRRQDVEFLRYVLESGLVPGRVLTIESAEIPADTFCVVFEDGRRLALGGKVAAAIQAVPALRLPVQGKISEKVQPAAKKPAEGEGKTAKNENLQKNILLKMNEINLF